MGQPPKGTRSTFSVRLHPDLAELVIDESEQMGWTRNDYISAILAKVHNYSMPRKLLARPKMDLRPPDLDDRWTTGIWPASLAGGRGDPVSLDRDGLASLLMFETSAERCGLAPPQFATALDIPMSRLEAYATGAREVPASLLLRAARVGQGLRRSTAQGWMDPVAAGRALNALAPTLNSDDRDRGPGIRASKEAIDVAIRCAGDLRTAAGRGERFTHAWQAAPASSGLIEWDALLAALVQRQHEQLMAEPPSWTAEHRTRLPQVWTVPHQGLTARAIQVRTPHWLMARRIHLDAGRLPSELTRSGPLGTDPG